MKDRAALNTESVGRGLDEQDFRDGLSVLAGPVTIVATQEANGLSRGFTASSVVPISLSPPLVGVCVSQDADCYQAFIDAPGFAISVLGREHEDLARRFASKGADKFEGVPVEWTPSGMPAIPGSLVVLDCATVDHVVAGDHNLLIACLLEANVRKREGPLVYFDRSFASTVAF